MFPDGVFHTGRPDSLFGRPAAAGKVHPRRGISIKDRSMQPGSDGKTSPGSPFRPPPAVIWNNMVDAGRAFAQSRFDSGPPARTRPRQTDLIKLKNSSGADRARGEILKIEGTILTEQDAEEIWLDGVEPTTECRFGILKEPSVSGEINQAQVSGVCLAMVNIIDVDHTFASAEDEEYVLQSGESGSVEILYAPDGTGEKECVVRFGGMPRLMGTLTEDLTAPTDGLTAPTTAVVAIWQYVGGTSAPREFEESAREVTITNRDTSLTAGEGVFIRIEWVSGEWVPYWVGC